MAVNAGERIFRAGEPAESMALVIAGQMYVSVRNSEGHESALTHLDPGEFIGEMALLEGGPRSASLEAIEPGELLILGRQGFFELLAGSPDSLAAMLHYLRGSVDVAAFESELATQRLRLEMEAERYRSLAQMVAGVAHEVNTPLGIINTASTIIQREFASGTMAQMARSPAGNAACRPCSKPRN